MAGPATVSADAGPSTLPPSPADKHPASVPALLASLRELRRTHPKLVRSTVHVYPPSVYAPADADADVARDLPELRFTSWKMTEYMYAKDNPFPTLARGLFTEHLGAGRAVPEAGRAVPEAARDSYAGGAIEDRIAARGYDKFFNVAETPWTEWDAIAQHTSGPYHLTLKSNGCLILISALDQEHLLVASKHSLGTTIDEPEPEHGHDAQLEPQPELDERGETAGVADGVEGAPAVAESSLAAASAGAAVASETIVSKEQAKMPRHIPGAPRDARAGGAGAAPADGLAREVASLDLGAAAHEGEDVGGGDAVENGGKVSKNQKKKEDKRRARAKLKAEQAEQAAHDRAQHSEPVRRREGADGGDGSDEKEHGEAKVHAEVGRAWVRRTLTSSGKTEGELARRLWDDNLTAVLELCDDSFEEHVIATPAHFTGLHLHGLNRNVPHFSTLAPADVAAFAADFGFIQTKFVELDSVDAVRAFTDDVAKTGAWEGDMIEGFVVRATVKDVGGDGPAGAAGARGRPPYRPGAPFFWKIKFDEPYLLYRQWREVTRVLLDLLPGGTKTADEVWKAARAKCKRQEVALYATWAGQRVQDEPELFDNYDKGVVRVRERFLAWTESEGRQAWAAAQAGKWKWGAQNGVREEKREGLPKKHIVVPVAVPGTGKTAIGVALAQLFGFGHTQSDDVTTKKSAPTFLRNIRELSRTHDVVYADRNNHLQKHYDELHDIASTKEKAQRFINDYDVRLIALAWDVERHPHHRVLRVCADRVAARGGNHQTLRPAAAGGEFGGEDHEAVIGKFLRDYTAPDPTLFDEVIEIDVLADQRAALGAAVDGLTRVLGLAKPSDEAVSAALEAAGAYRATPRAHEASMPVRDVRYYGLAPELDLEALAERVAASPMSDPARASARSLVDRLAAAGRFTVQPHVTLAHEANVAQEREQADAAAPADGPAVAAGAAGPETRAWDACKRAAERAERVMFGFDVVGAVWDGRLMALVLSPLRGEAGAQLELSPATLAHLHVTVGTVDETVRGFESRAVLAHARAAAAAGHATGEGGEAVEGGGAVHWVDLDPAVSGEGRVKGMW